MKREKVLTWEESLSEYEKHLRKLQKEHGGWVNIHTHLDRADTLDPIYWEHAGINPLEAATFPLKVKQNLVGELHKGPAYTKEDLERRINHQLERMILLGTKKVCSLIDATPDIGLRAIDVALKMKKKFKGRIEFIVGTQPIFGFKNPQANPDRWETFVEASRKADVIGALPEKDDSPTRIGFNEHIKRVIKLGIELGKEVHVHVDQGNDPREKETETLSEAVKWLGSPMVEGCSGPTVWAVHAISPSCYEEKNFKKLLEKMKEANIGVISCPRAGISMRQLRPIQTPTHNCIARLLEMVKFEIPIRIGTDNIADIFVPTGDANMLKEIEYLSDTLRYYIEKLWAKICCDEPLNDMDRELVSRALYQDRKAFQKINPNFP